MSSNSNLKTIDGETNLEFPCDFTFKVMGYANPRFEQTVIRIFDDHLPNDQINMQKRFSRTEKYLSISVTIKAHSKPQLDAIYQDLSANKAILWVL